MGYSANRADALKQRGLQLQAALSQGTSNAVRQDQSRVIGPRISPGWNRSECTLA
jgi:hypothetical protein